MGTVEGTRVSLIINTTKLIKWQTSCVSIIEKCTASAIKDAATSLRNGNLVAFPTETVYGLGADAQNKDAVAKIYQVKGRPVSHPLIVHLSSIEHLEKWAIDIPDYAVALARTFWPGPMTLILPRTKLAKDFITGGQDNVGIRVPSHTVALALLKEFESQGGLGVAAPSANRFGAVSPTSADAVRTELDRYLSNSDLILDGGQCIIGIESTIINCTQSQPTILRPGGVTKEAVQEVLGIKINSNNVNTLSNKIKVPGLLDTHYAPNAKVFITGSPRSGDGFIALASIATPEGAIRLATPENNEEYAHCLYQAFRVADRKGLEKVFAVPAIGIGVAVAINDRLSKAAFLE
jgi:L-threonylcarbamoyladenylate synthase